MISFIDHLLAKKPHERPSSREALMLIPTFVKKAYEARKQAKNAPVNPYSDPESSLDDSFSNFKLGGGAQPEITEPTPKTLNIGTS